MSNNPYSYLDKYATETPNRAALVFGSMVCSFQRLFQISTQVASAMRKAGLKKGQVALLSGYNPFVSVLLTLGAMHEAAIGAPQVGPKYNPALEADICFSGEYIDGFPKAKTVIVDKNWLSASEELVPLPLVDFPAHDSAIRLLQTSGTTGQPKVLEFGFESLADACDAWVFAAPDSVRSQLDTGSNFSLLPFSLPASFGFWVNALRTGKPFHLSTGDRDSDVAMIKNYDITWISASPSMINDIFHQLQKEDISKIKAVVTFGAAMAPETFNFLRSKSDAVFINRFGSTESTTIVAWKEIEMLSDDSLAGEIMPDSDVRVVDDGFNALPNGEVGRIGFRAKYMRTEYRNNPEATAKHFVDGYFYSGDEGYFTDSRQLYLVGRSDERMNFGGRKVDPNLVDATIRAISGIRDAAVFGFDQPSGIRGLAAAVVAESNYSDEKLMKAISEALGSKRPQVLIRVKSITRNAMGKVQRIDLEKELSDEANKRAK